MARGILFVESRPSEPSRQAEYDDWYANTHIPQVCAIPGFVGARRYRVRSGEEGGGAAPATVTLYEIEADDLDAPITELRARSADGRMNKSDALGMDPPPTVALYELIE